MKTEYSWKADSGNLQFTELLQRYRTSRRTWICQCFNCLYIFESMWVILQSLLTLCPVTSPSQLGQRAEACVSSPSMASALPQELLSTHTVLGTSRSTWEQGLACLWLFPSARWWSWFLAWRYMFHTAGLSEKLWPDQQISPRGMCPGAWSNQIHPHR